MKTSKLIGVALNWAVAKCEGRTTLEMPELWPSYRYSSNWTQGGPIVERMLIAISAHLDGDEWVANDYWNDNRYTQVGPTPLIAAMRCYVASYLGDEVDVPEEIADPHHPDCPAVDGFGCHCDELL